MVGLFLAFSTIATAHSPHDEILALQFSPRFAVDLILFAIVRFNLLRSVDRGLTWVRSVRGLAGVPLLDCAVSPRFNDDHTVLAVSPAGGIYRSTDAGLSWRPAAHPPDRLPLSRVFISVTTGSPPIAHVVGRAGELWSSSDLGDSWAPCRTENLPVTCIAAGGDSLLAGTGTGHILHSVDCGRSWRTVHRWPRTFAITDLAVHPKIDGSAMLAIGASGGGVTVLKLDALRITPLHHSLQRERVTSLTWALPLTGPPLLFASTWRSGCHRSADCGQTWASCSEGLTTDPQADEDAFRSPHFRRVCASPDFAVDETLAIAGFDGLFVSTDAGRGWRERRCVLPINLIVGVDAAAASPTSTAIAVSTYDAGPFISLDSGRTWQSRASGIGESRAFGIALSPDFARDSSVFLATNWSLYRSQDAGASWTGTPLLAQQHGSKTGMPALGALRRVGALVADHLGAAPYRTLRRLFHRARGSLGLRLPLPGFGAVVVASPTFSRDGTLYLAAGHRVWRSSDRGVSLVPVFVPRSGTIGAIALSPNHVVDHSILIAAEEELLLSTDEGITWNRMWASHGPRISAIAFSPRFAENRTLFAAAGGRLFRSPDLGKNWESLAPVTTEEPTVIDAILSSASAPDEILIHAAGQGLFISADAGENFRGPLSGPDRDDGCFSHLEDFPDRSSLVRLSPHYDSDRMVVAAAQDRLCLSHDGGRDWSSIKLPSHHSADRPEIVYRGKWTSCDTGGATKPRGRRTRQPSASALLDFVGTGIRWIGERAPANGVADILIDGRLVAQVDQRAQKTEAPALCYQSPVLPLAPHTFEIRRARTPSGAAPAWLAILALEVLEEAAEPVLR